jgi:tRNA A37 threonylcarbamoyladenosine modification protein TsaB
VGGLRCPLLDARRGEVFAAVYDAAGTMLVPPRALPRTLALSELERLTGGAERVLVGEVALELEGPPPVHRAPETDLPHAAFIGAIGAKLAGDGSPVEPLSVREPDAAKPRVAPDTLVRSLGSGERS